MGNFLTKDILMDCVSIGSLMIAVAAIFVSALSVFHGTTQKAYEILLNKRLQNFQEIKDCFQNLRKLLRKQELLKQCGRDEGAEYCEQLMEGYNRLESFLSRTDATDFCLMEQVMRTIKLAENICASAKQSRCDLEKLEEEAAVTFLFADVYCWTIWWYYQNLHKYTGHLKSYDRSFDKNIKKIYARAKHLHQNSVFFERYSIDKILGKERNDKRNKGETAHG